MVARTRKPRFPERDGSLGSLLALDISLLKGFLPKSNPGASKDPGRTESEGGPRVGNGWSQDKMRPQLDGMAQCFCDLAPPITGLDVTYEVAGGASAAWLKLWLCQEQPVPSPSRALPSLGLSLLTCMMKEPGDLNVSLVPLCSNAS